MSQGPLDFHHTPTPCQYTPEGESPHQHLPYTKQPKICSSILEAIGNTPLVRLNQIPREENIQCEILVKCEFMNPGGSVKDRICRRMIEDAERSGRINSETTVIEPTSGNTGIGLAMACAAKGLKMIATMPERMSAEKADTLTILGAELHRTPDAASFTDERSHIGLAHKLNREIENSVFLDQYSNPSNPLAHYDQTAEEILDQCDGRLDYIVLTAGTGGSATGIGRKLKERLPNVKVIGVDPMGSVLAEPADLNGQPAPWQVEGPGQKFVPRTCQRQGIDLWYKVSDRDSFQTARRAIRSEGLLIGGSAGSAIWAALQVAKDLPADKRVVALLPDGIRNYMTKFVNDAWMRENGFSDQQSVRKQMGHEAYQE